MRKDERDADRLLGSALADQRKEASLTQEQLASRAGLNPKYVSQLEGGRKSPTLRTFRKLAAAMSLPSWELLRRLEAEASGTRGPGSEEEAQ